MRVSAIASRYIVTIFADKPLIDDLQMSHPFQQHKKSHTPAKNTLQNVWLSLTQFIFFYKIVLQLCMITARVRLTLLQQLVERIQISPGTGLKNIRA